LSVVFPKTICHIFVDNLLNFRVSNVGCIIANSFKLPFPVMRRRTFDALEGNMIEYLIAVSGLIENVWMVQLVKIC
jgi:hypothetical protein